MPRVGFEHIITVFELAKTFHTLDCATTVIGPYWILIVKLSLLCSVSDSNFRIRVKESVAWPIYAEELKTHLSSAGVFWGGPLVKMRFGQSSSSGHHSARKGLAPSSWKIYIVGALVDISYLKKADQQQSERE
jgi:hypothetical protein